LKGPNNDWPLALCDYRTVDLDEDAIANDVLFETAIGENELLFPSDSHQWYYLSNQQIDEVIVFRNAVCGTPQKPRKSTNPPIETSD